VIREELERMAFPSVRIDFFIMRQQARSSVVICASEAMHAIA
jgi:hypothetical protein